jgi:hypothetical protein
MAENLTIKILFNIFYFLRLEIKNNNLDNNETLRFL